MSIGVILVAAGAGRRFGGPKAFVELAGRTLVERAAAAFAAFDARVCVLQAGDLDRAPAGWRAVPGGARRRDSVAAGLAALGDVDAVLVHDAARPMVSHELVARVAAALRRAAAVVPVVPLADTIKEVRDGRVVRTLNRAALAAVQTPQGFDAALLRRALAASDADATDEAGLVEALGEPVATVEGDPRNLKITGPADLVVAAALV